MLERRGFDALHTMPSMVNGKNAASISLLLDEDLLDDDWLDDDVLSV